MVAVMMVEILALCLMPPTDIDHNARFTDKKCINFMLQSTDQADQVHGASGLRRWVDIIRQLDIKEAVWWVTMTNQWQQGSHWPVKALVHRHTHDQTKCRNDSLAWCDYNAARSLVGCLTAPLLNAWQSGRGAAGLMVSGDKRFSDSRRLSWGRVRKTLDRDTQVWAAQLADSPQGKYPIASRPAFTYLRSYTWDLFWLIDGTKKN